MSNCGACSDSCCTSFEVPGGTFYRTYNTALSTSGPPGGGWTDQADPATVSGFRLDKYLVTVGRFRQFVNAVLPPGGGMGWLPSQGSGTHAYLNKGRGLANSGSAGGHETGWDTSWNGNVSPTDANLACQPPFNTWTIAPGKHENLPINCVNWWESYAFCIWDGGFLPSEAEWEYAAAGGSQQREYPWGSANPGMDNEYAIYNSYYAGSSPIPPVGTATLGVGLWGQLDMAGELGEWNVDWYATYVDPCTDCVYLTATPFRVMRGSYFVAPASELLPPYRYEEDPSSRINLVGLRCSRRP